ncbi:unnamed protein product [Ambrosiozyma monospora]|uniref:Unnamed protein product n=1 Tax=Ambrosiozyma monospora TaxID=43982 RepID=A0ACB5U5L8_AMBMO|nr:unnamed protein product [Ambrosiozyma monospora]
MSRMAVSLDELSSDLVSDSGKVYLERIEGSCFRNFSRIDRTNISNFVAAGNLDSIITHNHKTITHNHQIHSWSRSSIFKITSPFHTMDAALQAARAIAVAEEAARSAYQTLQQTSAQWATNSTSDSTDKSNQNESSEGSNGNNNENGKFDLDLEFVGYPPSTSSSGNQESNIVPISNVSSVPLTKDIGSGSKRPSGRNRRNNISAIINDKNKCLL